MWKKIKEYFARPGRRRQLVAVEGFSVKLGAILGEGLSDGMTSAGTTALRNRNIPLSLSAY
jgi:hypothetical protein